MLSPNDWTGLPDRPSDLPSSTTKDRYTRHGDAYVVLGWYQDKPVEVFIHWSHQDACLRAMSEALCRMVSLSLRRGVSVDEIVSQLRGIACTPEHTQLFEGGSTTSVPDMLAKALLTATPPPSSSVSAPPPSKGGHDG